MGLQKYRADQEGQKQSDGAVPWYAEWMGGQTLALLRHAPTPWGPRTIYLTGDADTFFTIPAACRVRGRTVRGFVSVDMRAGVGELVFCPYTEEVARMNEWLAERGGERDAET